MKNALLIALSALLISTGALAKDIANYRFAVSEVVDGQHTVKVLNTTITDDQVMKVTLTRATGSMPWNMTVDGETESFEKDLNNLVFEQIKTQVVSISNAPIKRVQAEIVCMMMPGPAQANDHLSVARGYDWNSRSFLGDLELVMGPQGCWVRNPVFPANERAAGQARALKASIKLLTLEFIGNL